MGAARGIGSMKVFISADIEGIGGVATWDQARTDGPDHAHARRWMTGDVNAAVEGALAGGATEVLVRDAHGRARNILWEDLHPAARLLSGWDPDINMTSGLDPSFGLVLLIGYHPGPAVPRGVLSHTFTTRIRTLTLNGLPCNEAVVAALQAGTLGIPVGLVTGQAELQDEIRPALPHTGFVSVKQGVAYQSAILEPHVEVRRRITEGARDAVAARVSGKGAQPFRPDPPLTLALGLTTAEAALAVAALPGVERVAPADVTLTAETADELLSRFFRALTVLYSVRDNV